MNLECKQCGYENESQRVYCHSCGAKLDRTVLPEDTTEKQASSSSVRRRVRNLTSPGRFTLGRLFKMVFSAVFFGFIAASLIAAVLPPHDVPAAKTDTLDAPDVSGLIRDALSSGRPVAFSEDQLNSFLARFIRAKKSDSWRKYTRTFVRLKPGEVWTSIEYAIFDYPVFVSVGHSPHIENGKLQADAVGGYLGRLPIYPALMPFLARPLHSLADPLKEERRMMDTLRAVQVTEKKAVLIPRAPQSPPG